MILNPRCSSIAQSEVIPVPDGRLGNLSRRFETTTFLPSGMLHAVCLFAVHLRSYWTTFDFSDDDWIAMNTSAPNETLTWRELSK